MLTILVKNYLTPEGFDYFRKEWYPKLLSIAQQQKGFVSLTYKVHPDVYDCIHLTLKFKDDKSLAAWVELPSHDEIINELDGYRSRKYWEAASTEDENIDPSNLEWETIKVSS